MRSTSFVVGSKVTLLVSGGKRLSGETGTGPVSMPVVVVAVISSAEEALKDAKEAKASAEEYSASSSTGSSLARFKGGSLEERGESSMSWLIEVAMVTGKL